MKAYFSGFYKNLVYGLIIFLGLYIIDYFNVLTWLLKYGLLFYIASVVIILIVIINSIRMGLYSSLRMPIKTKLDDILQYIIICGVLGFFVYLYEGLSFKGFVYAGSIIIAIFLVVLRLYYLKKGEKIKRRKQYTDIDLKDLLENKISPLEEKLFFIKETDVEYDLLNRSGTINTLYNTIVYCNPSSKFVISLEGSWGSGKTTILNILKKKLDEVKDLEIISDFDPWAYDDKESMLRAMFTTIINKSNIKYNSIEAKKMMESLSHAIFTTAGYENFFKIVSPQKGERDTLGDIKARIEEYIGRCNKRFVFIIDNIDRADKDNILLLFKSMACIFDFSEIIYVISFDDIKVKKIMEDNLKIDYSYLEKIIQLPVKIPDIDEQRLKTIMNNAVVNLLKIYGATQDEVSIISICLGEVYYLLNDLRRLKRALNSIITFNFYTNRRLNVMDAFFIDLIRMYNYTLYRSIKENSKYYISTDKGYSEYISPQRFNTSAKSYFVSLFSDTENEKYNIILSNMFPYVKKYNDNVPLESESRSPIDYDQEAYIQVQKDKRIFSGRYFNLYFTNETNLYVELHNLFCIKARELVSAEDYRKDNFIVQLLKDLNPDALLESMEILSLHIKDFSLACQYEIAHSLMQNFNYEKNYSKFLALPTISRIASLIADSIIDQNEEAFEDFINAYKNSIHNFIKLRQLNYWIRNDKHSNNSDKEKKASFIEEILVNMALRIEKERINIFDNDLYVKGILHILYNKWEEAKIDVKEYIKTVVNKTNIVRFIYELCQVWTGTGMSFVLYKSDLDKFSSEEEIDELLSRKQHFTVDEEMVIEAYRFYKNKHNKDSDEGKEFNINRTLII